MTYGEYESFAFRVFLVQFFEWFSVDFSISSFEFLEGEEIGETSQNNAEL
jgi:hypothetical protein